MSELSLYVKHRQVVVPGELVAKGKFRAGQNVIRVGDDNFYATVIGSFELRDKGVLAVRALRGPYIPRRGDKVIGQVVDISMGSWAVDIRSPYEATLPASKFPARINPVLDDIRKYLNVSEYVYAEIAEFDRVKSPTLDATLNREYGPIRRGLVITVEPTRVPRLIGKKGSMVQLLNKELGAKIVVAQNGYVWIRADDQSIVNKAVQVVRKIESEAHVQGLTSKIEELLITLKNSDKARMDPEKVGLEKRTEGSEESEVHGD